MQIRLVRGIGLILAHTTIFSWRTRQALILQDIFSAYASQAVRQSNLKSICYKRPVLLNYNAKSREVKNFLINKRGTLGNLLTLKISIFFFCSRNKGRLLDLPFGFFNLPHDWRCGRTCASLRSAHTRDK